MLGDEVMMLLRELILMRLWVTTLEGQCAQMLSVKYVTGWLVHNPFFQCKIFILSWP